MKYINEKTFILIILTVLSAVDSLALNRTDYYRLSASVSPSGAGYVYLSETPVEEAKRIYDVTASLPTSVTTRKWYYSTASASIYAKPKNSAYIFTGWTGNGVTFSSSTATYSTTNTNTSEKNPATFSITANFKYQTGMAKVHSADEYGSVDISNPDNTAGEKIKIYAFPGSVANQDAVFEHWGMTTTDQLVNEVRTDLQQEATITVPETEIHYWAHFSSPVNPTGYFCRIKDDSGRYLSMIGTTIGERGNEGSDKEPKYYYDLNCFTLLPAKSDVSTDASTVFYMSGTNVTGSDVALSNINLQSQAVSLRNVLSNRSTLKTANTSYTNGTSRILIEYIDDNGSDNLFLRTKNDKVQIGGSDTNSNVDWIIEPITDSNPFGVKASSRGEIEEGRYLTTLYTKFAYQLPSGVQAYYLGANGVADDFKTVTLTEISEGSVVPADFPVIIETGTAGALTQLTPVVQDASAVVPKNFLQGWIKLNDDAFTSDDVERARGVIYTLSGDGGKVKFRQFKGSLTTNRAFAVINKDDAAKAAKATFILGSNVVTNIDRLLDFSTVDAPMYDLQGRRVQNPKRGIYIQNGQKVIIK